MQNNNTQPNNLPNPGSSTPRNQGPASNSYIAHVEQQRNAPRKPYFR